MTEKNRKQRNRSRSAKQILVDMEFAIKRTTKRNGYVYVETIRTKLPKKYGQCTGEEIKDCITRIRDRNEIKLEFDEKKRLILKPI